MLQGSMVRGALMPAAPDWSADDARDDALLLRRLARGDARALETLYQRHAAALFGYLLALNQERTVAEEVLQDTFLAAWQAAGSFRGGASVRTWLFAISRRQARDPRRHHPTVAGDDEYLTVADSGPGPEQAALDRAELQDLVAGINELGPLHREVLALVFVHELSYAEAAHVLEVPIGTVRSRLSAARRRLHVRRNGGRESAHDR